MYLDELKSRIKASQPKRTKRPKKKKRNGRSFKSMNRKLWGVRKIPINTNIIESKGEEVIEKVLIKLGLLYKREYMFKGCINPGTGVNLRFDFYIPNLNLCIEFDGIQHFEPSVEFHGKNAKIELQKQKYRDEIKNKYCIVKNIKLIRFNYKQYSELENLVELYFKKTYKLIYLVKLC